MKISLAGGAYSQAYHDISVQRCVNWYTQISSKEEKAKEGQILLPTAGTEEWLDLSSIGDRIRGMRVHKGILYVVVGNKFYSVTKSRTKTLLGTLDTIGHLRRVLIDVNFNDQIFIADNDLAYVYSVTAGTFTKITDTDYPGADSLSYVDGYIIAVRNNLVAYSAVNDVTSWNALDVFNPTFASDKVLAAITFQEAIVAFGEYTVEVYTQTGNSDAPWERIPRSTVLYGIGAIDSLVRFYGGLLFLGRSQYGGYAVYMANLTYEIQQVSPSSINQQLNTEDDLSDAFAYLYYNFEGHPFYTITFPSIDRTFVYDILTNEWHERASLKPYVSDTGQPLQGMLRNNCIEYFYGQVLYGDYYSGVIYKENRDLSTEAGNTITRLRVSPIMASNQAFVTVDSIELDVNSGAGLLSGQGSNPYVMFSSSIDGGQTWADETLLELGLRGKYSDRVNHYLLGTGRNWVVSIKVTDPIPVVINSLIVTTSVEPGDNGVDVNAGQQ